MNKVKNAVDQYVDSGEVRIKLDGLAPRPSTKAMFRVCSEGKEHWHKLSWRTIGAAAGQTVYDEDEEEEGLSRTRGHHGFFDNQAAKGPTLSHPNPPPNHPSIPDNWRDAKNHEKAEVLWGPTLTLT